jgi:transcriptional regulator with XRE-family HTH domain
MSTFPALRTDWYAQVMSDFGKRFASARKQLGLTQQDVAATMNVSRVAVSHYEQDKMFPGLDALAQYCRETGISMDWLVLGREPAGSFDARLNALPDALKVYILQALVLAESVQQSLPAKFLAPPTSANYAAFSEYLTRLSEEVARDGARKLPV